MIIKEKIILFGAGDNAKRIINYFGIDKIEFIIDNYKGIGHEELKGIEIKCFHRIEKDSLRDKIIVITPDNDKVKIEIMGQLMEIGCNRWVFGDMLTENIECFNYNDEEKYVKALNIYKRLYEDIIDENAYLREHIRPKDLRPAKGYLRKRQLDLVGFASEVSKMFEEIDIKLILSAGNLLGLIRHEGFIPWDDDIDFKLLREDYERLKDYCKKDFIYKKYEGLKGVNVEYMNFKKTLFEKYPNEYIFLELPEHCQILRGTNAFDGLCVDLFVIDSYRSDYLFSEHREKIDYLKKRLAKCVNCSQQYVVLKDYLDNDNKNWDVEGDNLFYGGDNVESYAYYIDYDQFLKREDLLPLKKEEYEGHLFWIPNHLRKCVEYVFGENWEEFPPTIGVERHSYWKLFFEEYYDSADIIYDEKYRFESFEELYHSLRADDIYARIVIPRYKKTNLNLEKLKGQFDEKGIEWSFAPNKCANVCYTDCIDAQKDYNDAIIITLEKEITGDQRV